MIAKYHLEDSRGQEVNIKMNFKTNFARKCNWIQHTGKSINSWVLFICDLFNDAFVSSDAMTSYVKMIVEE
jgi:hypothetical protein